MNSFIILVIGFFVLAITLFLINDFIKSVRREGKVKKKRDFSKGLSIFLLIAGVLLPALHFTGLERAFEKDPDYIFEFWKVYFIYIFFWAVSILLALNIELKDDSKNKPYLVKSMVFFMLSIMFSFFISFLAYNSIDKADLANSYLAYTGLLVTLLIAVFSFKD